MSSSESEQAHKPEEGRPSERPPGRASTIIVDPGLIAEAERISESQRPPAAAAAAEEPEPSANGAHGSDAVDAAEEENDALSIEEAERFATAFRASWEPLSPNPVHGASASSRPAPNGPASSRPAPSAAVARTPSVPAQPVAPPVLLSELPGARRGRTLALASAAVAAFIVILVLGWWASSPSDAPEPASAWDEPAPAEKSERAKAAPPPAAVPVAPPAAPQVAVPAAAEPQAIAPAEAAPSDLVAAPAEAAPAAVLPPPAPEPVKAPEPVLVALQITTRPSSAKLTLDGSPIDNPYDAMHPQGESHVVEATAPGYQSRNLKIELSQKRSVALELEKDRVAETPKPAAAPRPKRPRVRTPKAVPASKKGAAFVEESPY